MCYSIDPKYFPDENFDNMNGYQVQAVKLMMDRILTTLDTTYDYEQGDVTDKFDIREWGSMRWFQKSLLDQWRMTKMMLGGH